MRPSVGESLTLRKVRWGVLGVASIAVRRVIPAMQKGDWGGVVAIASRELSKAERAAEALGVPKAYGSYEELLADPAIEAIYNPLPNNLHVPWSVRAAEAGKHVLCEKPLGVTADEARGLLAVRDRTGVKIGEAFMVRTHPRWLRTRELAQAGRIGQLRVIPARSAISMATSRIYAICPNTVEGRCWTLVATRLRCRGSCSGTSRRARWDSSIAIRRRRPTG